MWKTDRRWDFPGRAPVDRGEVGRGGVKIRGGRGSEQRRQERGVNQGGAEGRDRNGETILVCAASIGVPGLMMRHRTAPRALRLRPLVAALAK